MAQNPQVRCNMAPGILGTSAPPSARVCFGHRWFFVGPSSSGLRREDALPIMCQGHSIELLEAGGRCRKDGMHVAPTPGDWIILKVDGGETLVLSNAGNRADVLDGVVVEPEVLELLTALNEAHLGDLVPGEVQGEERLERR